MCIDNKKKNSWIIVNTHYIYTDKNTEDDTKSWKQLISIVVLIKIKDMAGKNEK